MGERHAIELIARGVCVVGERVLLCHSKGASNTFLPGGHVEWRESATAALAREMEEELGLAADVGGFLGAVEHRFVQDRQNRPHHELNLVFLMEIPDVAPAIPPASRESGIEFLWTALSDLGDSRLEPWPLRELVPRWLKTGADAGEGWGSTFDR